MYKIKVNSRIGDNMKYNIGNVEISIEKCGNMGKYGYYIVRYAGPSYVKCESMRTFTIANTMRQAQVYAMSHQN